MGAGAQYLGQVFEASKMDVGLAAMCPLTCLRQTAGREALRHNLGIDPILVRNGVQFTHLVIDIFNFIVESAKKMVLVFIAVLDPGKFVIDNAYFMDDVLDLVPVFLGASGNVDTH